MSRPESVSSSTARRGASSAICRISLRFFSPPEKPTLTPRRSISRSMPSLPAASFTRLRNSGVDSSGSPRFLRCALSAVRRNVMVATPGISSGYWNARKMPRAARSSGSSASRSTPSNVTVPPVTSYWSLPASTWASVDLPEPFGPMMAWTSPAFTVRSRPLSISRPSTVTLRSLISSIATSFFPFKILQTEVRDDLRDQLALLGGLLARLIAPERLAAHIDLALLAHYDQQAFREVSLIGPFQDQATVVEVGRDTALPEFLRRRDVGLIEALEERTGGGPAPLAFPLLLGPPRLERGQRPVELRHPRSTDRTLEADRDQFLRLDRELHRQLLQH